MGKLAALNVANISTMSPAFISTNVYVWMVELNSQLKELSRSFTIYRNLKRHMKSRCPKRQNNIEFNDGFLSGYTYTPDVIT